MPASLGWLVVPPRRVPGSTRRSSPAGARRRRPVLGTLCWPPTLVPLMAFLADPHGLGDHGEVMVGWKRGIASTSPCRPGQARLTEVPAAEFPSLNAATSGEFGFMPTTDYRDRDVLVAYRPLGIGYPNWGLIAKVDKAEATSRCAAPPAAAGIGGGLLALGLGASNAIARRFARPIKRLARTAGAVAAGDLTVRSEVSSSDEIGRPGPGIQSDDRGAGAVVRRPRAADRRADRRPGPLRRRCASRPASSSRSSTAWATVSSSPTRPGGSWSSTRRRSDPRLAGPMAPLGEWSRHYEVFQTDRVTPFPSMDLPLIRAMRGESIDQAELYIALSQPRGRDLDHGHGPPAAGRAGDDSREAWASFTTSPAARRPSGGWPRSTRRPACWPRPIRSARRARRSSRRSAPVSTGTSAPSGELTLTASPAMRDVLEPAGAELPLRGRELGDRPECGCACLAALGRVAPEPDPGHRRRARVPPRRRPPTRPACTPPSPCRSSSRAIAWASSSSSAARPGRLTRRRST